MDSLYIIATSNSSVSIYKDNTLSRFVNVLAAERAIGYKFQKIAVQSVYIDNKFQSGTTPKLIKVQLDEIQPCLSGRGFHKDIALISGSELSTAPFHYTVKHKEYFDLNEPTLKQLSVTLADQDNKQLQLKDGHATVIIFKLKTLPMASKILRLSSTHSSELFPSNTLSSFRVMLQEPLSYSTPSEVALSSLFLPSVDINTKQIIDDAGGIRIKMRIEKDVSTPTGVKKRWDETAFDFTDLSEYSLSNIMETWMSKLDASSPLKIVKEDNLYQLLADVDMTIQMSRMCAYLFGLTDKSKGPEIFFPIEQGKKSTRLRAFKPEKCHPAVIMVHCNFVAPSMLGSDMSRVLKVLPFANNLKTEKLESLHYEFFPLNLTDNNLLHFELRDAAGNFIPFVENTEAEVLVNLIFRQKMF